MEERVRQGSKRLTLFLLIVVLLLLSTPCSAQSGGFSVPLGREYSDYNKNGGRAPAPGRPDESTWGSPVESNTSNSSTSRGVTLEGVLLYLPNRLLDFIDIFRLDVGVGPSFGYVARATRFAQIGYREMNPISVRVGARGRKLPIFVERENEIGIGPSFAESSARDITPLETGLGIDLVIVGAYAGVSWDEAWDFLAGIIAYDPKGDDLN